jgi:hypothetical protein
VAARLGRFCVGCVRFHPFETIGETLVLSTETGGMPFGIRNLRGIILAFYFAVFIGIWLFFSILILIQPARFWPCFHLSQFTLLLKRWLIRLVGKLRRKQPAAQTFCSFCKHTITNLVKEGAKTTKKGLIATILFSEFYRDKQLFSL